jgi:hypothetical protein
MALGRAVRNLGALAVPSLRRTEWSALWAERFAMARGHLSSRRNLDLLPRGEILWCSGSAGHQGRPETT